MSTIEYRNFLNKETLLYLKNKLVMSPSIVNIIKEVGLRSMRVKYKEERRFANLIRLYKRRLNHND